jgi:hypothetical protein
VLENPENWALASKAWQAIRWALADGGINREKELVSFVPQLQRRILKMLIRRGVADSGVRNGSAQVF